MSCESPISLRPEGRISHGCVLLHGFTGGPWEMEDLGKFLFSKGIAVECPLLPGHGSLAGSLAVTRWHEWHQSAYEALEKLKKKCDKVFVCGQSLGGCLALHLAAHYTFDGVITLAAGTKINDWRIKLIPFLKMFISRIKKKPADIAHKQNTSNHVAQTIIPLNAAIEVIKFYSHVENDLTEVHIPILLFHSINDHVVRYENAHHILSKVSSQSRELITLTKSFHVLTLDIDRNKIFDKIGVFITQTL